MAINEGPSPNSEESLIIQTSERYTQENQEARRLRLEQNRINWDVYHCNQDFAHKRQGQSREFIPKQAMAVEQITEFFQQGLMDIDDWWRCDYARGINPASMPLTNFEIKAITDRYLDDLNDEEGLLPFVGDGIKSGLLGSVIIVKVHGGIKKKSFYTFQNRVVQNSGFMDSLMSMLKPKIEPTLQRGFKKEWELKLDLIQPFEFGMDPTGKGMYEFQEVWLDWHEAIALSEGEDAIYDKATLEACGSEMSDEWRIKLEKSRETNQPIPYENRKKVKIQEFWGKVVNLTTGELLYENVVWTVANNRWLIQKPTPNPFWHGKSPFIVAPILRVPNGVWHKALMDSPTKLNIAINELYNLMLDSGMMAAYGIKQYRPDYIADDSSVSEGFYAGQSVAVTADCPPGMKVLEQVATGSASQESLSMYNLVNAEFNQAALTNDLRMGVMPNRAVKATEVVEASNSINSIFTGLAKVLEDSFIARVLGLSWKTILQNADNLDSAEMQSILGQERALAIAQISPQERFAKCIDGTSFSVFGVSKTLAKSKDFKKLTALLQTISGSPVLLQEFSAEYSMQKLLGQILASLDINTEKLQMNDAEKQQSQQRQAQALQQQLALKQGGVAPNGAGGQSQIPQATTGSSANTLPIMGTNGS